MSHINCCVKEIIVEENVNKTIQVIGFTENADFSISRFDAGCGIQSDIVLLRTGCNHEDFLKVLQGVNSDEIMLVDLDRVAVNTLSGLGQTYRKSCRKEHVYYVSGEKRKLWFGFMDMKLWRAIGKSRVRGADRTEILVHESVCRGGSGSQSVAGNKL